MAQSAWVIGVVSLLVTGTLYAGGRKSKHPGFALKAEQTAFVETGRYEEVTRLCQELAQSYPEQVSCERFGTSPEGRPLWHLIVGSVRKSELARAQQRPVLLFQGGIHAGEIDGKDAGLLFVRDLLQNKVLAGILNEVTIVCVPVFNVDGHERFGPYQRPNQVGPKETGWRTTAQNYNLNRDYMKADAPEMQAMLQLLQRWDPLLYVDLHVTDGAQFEHDISVQIDPTQSGPKDLQQIAEHLTQLVMKGLSAKGHLPVSFYPSFRKEDDPLSGFEHAPQSPRFSNGYWALQNRLGVLVETHSWRPYAHRVQATYDTLLLVANELWQQHKAWRQTLQTIDRAEAQQAGQDLPLSFKNTETHQMIDFRGYAYERSLSPISGQLMTRYHPEKPEIWRVPLYSEVIPDQFAQVPRRGYLIPPAYRALIQPRLEQHGITYETASLQGEAELSAFHFQDVNLPATVQERHQRPQYKGSWQPFSEPLPAGYLFVPSAQPRIRLIMQLLEPASKESLAAWGFFNEVFERKEYMEDYVAEDVGRELLKDPKIKAEFNEKLAKDSEFAKDPKARLDFFYQRHPSFDRRWMRYPILRLN